MKTVKIWRQKKLNKTSLVPRKKSFFDFFLNFYAYLIHSAIKEFDEAD